MSSHTDDLRIASLHELNPPAEVIASVPLTDSTAELVSTSRQQMHQILAGDDDRLIVVIGPCSIHDTAAALDYAKRLGEQRQRFAGTLEIVMRVYFEKPRTTVGWKGLINDPDLDGSYQINKGLYLSRKLLADINALGVPAGSEFLDIITPQYLADLVAWGAIGARTTESQVHRELASGLSCPVGFKNGTDGNVRIAIDAVMAASQPHHFLAVTKQGRSAIAATSGNPDCHLILRGGREPNYDAAHVAAASEAMTRAGIKPSLMIDASHANSGKNPENQPAVIASVAEQVAAGQDCIVGVMIESHLRAGRQDLVPGQTLTYGQSITDGCIDWDRSVPLLEQLAAAVEQRRAKAAERRDRAQAAHAG